MQINLCMLGKCITFAVVKNVHLHSNEYNIFYNVKRQRYSVPDNPRQSGLRETIGFLTIRNLGMKRTLLSIIVLLMLSAGLAHAEKITYIYPEYNDGNVAKGIKEWKTGEADAVVVESTSDIVTWTAGWYVVNGADVTLSKGAVCNGTVHLILADGAKLTATGGDHSDPGIQVSGEGNSLTIYGQTAQSGQLIADGRVTAAGIGGGREQNGSNITINGGNIESSGGASGIGGGMNASGYNITINGGVVGASCSYIGGAGIGGGYGEDNRHPRNGYNITINGGTVEVTGGVGAAGIGGGKMGNGSFITINDGRVITTTLTYATEGEKFGAGIGGGCNGVGSNITITGGFVTAIGNRDASGIGKGEDAADGPGNIFVTTRCIVKAGESENPTDVIEHDGNTDLTSQLNGKSYVTVVYDLIDAYNNGYAAGETAGDAAGYKRAKNELPTDHEGTAGPAVVVTKGRKSVTLINPDKVEFIKK